MTESDAARDDSGDRVLILPDSSSWRGWLDEHESTSEGVWLALAKKGASLPTSLTYAQALDEALCSGWIDGRIQAVDATMYRRRFTPRGPRSLWSAQNTAHAMRLLTEGRMRRRGQDEVDRAMADGRWDAAYAGSATIDVPGDLAMALRDAPAARAAFETLSAQNRYAVLYRVTTARTAEVRERRIGRLIEMLAAGRTPHPQPARRRPSPR